MLVFPCIRICKSDWVNWQNLMFWILCLCLERKWVICCLFSLSLPSWERGLKCCHNTYLADKDKCRSPRGGADWNQCLDCCITSHFPSLPLVGGAGWNTRLPLSLQFQQRSLPTRERGLKYERIHNKLPERKVAPFVGARVEMHSDVAHQGKD